jgi:hypothetical protein
MKCGPPGPSHFIPKDFYRSHRLVLVFLSLSPVKIGDTEHLE